MCTTGSSMDSCPLGQRNPSAGPQVLHNNHTRPPGASLASEKEGVLMSPHPKGKRARVLLSSVFKPFAQDDEFGSRAINPVELYHNQVTREQGPFSLRMFHRSWSLMLLQRNISAPCTV